VAKKSNFIKLVEEKILYPFSRNHFDGKMKVDPKNPFKVNVEFDLVTFAKCLLCIWYQQLNNAMLIYEEGGCMQ
jgi:hypothetical protein